MEAVYDGTGCPCSDCREDETKYVFVLMCDEGDGAGLGFPFRVYEDETAARAKGNSCQIESIVQKDGWHWWVVRRAVIPALNPAP